MFSLRCLSVKRLLIPILALASFGLLAPMISLAQEAPATAQEVQKPPVVEPHLQSQIQETINTKGHNH